MRSAMRGPRLRASMRASGSARSRSTGSLAGAWALVWHESIRSHAVAMTDDQGMRSHCGHGWPLTMTVALPQPVAQACQRKFQSVRGWLVTARGCLQRPLALQQQRRGSPSRGRLGRGARGAAWPVGCGARSV